MTMQVKAKIYSVWAILALLVWSMPAVATEEYVAENVKKKEVKKVFKVSASDVLEIENQYGNITVTHWEKNEIEIRVVIEAKARNNKRVEELLEYADVRIEHSGNTVSGETSMANFGGTKNNERLAVHYYISKPAKIKPHLRLRYGNIILPQENEANTTLEVKYGNINAGDFTGKLKINSSYGNIEVGDFTDAQMTLAYCGTVVIGDGQDLSIDSRYSNGSLGDIEQLELEASYGKYKMNKIEAIELSAKYSNFDIQELGKELRGSFSYGTINIKHVSSALRKIQAAARYGKFNIYMPVNMSFDVVAHNMKYATYTISGGFNVTKEKNGHDHHTKVNNGHATRIINYEGNGYSDLTIKAD